MPVQEPDRTQVLILCVLLHDAGWFDDLEEEEGQSSKSRLCIEALDDPLGEHEPLQSVTLRQFLHTLCTWKDNQNISDQGFEALLCFLANSVLR